VSRYSTKERELVFKCAYDLEITDIKLLLQDHGYTRSLESIKKKVAQKLKEDKILKNHKAKKRANKDIVKHRAKTLINSAKTRAKTKELDFDLELDWVEQKLRAGKCEATGLTFIFTLYGEGNISTKTNPYAPSLDRINSNKGYTPDNVQITILAFNKFKSDMVQHSMIDIAKAIVKHHMRKRRFTVDN